MKLSRLTACCKGIQPERDYSWSANSTIAIRIHRPQTAVWINRERSNGHLAMVIVVRCDVVVWQVIRQIPPVTVLANPLLDRFLTAGRRIDQVSGRSVKGSKHAVCYGVFNIRSLAVAGRTFFVLVSDVGEVPLGSTLKEQWAFKVFQVAALVFLLHSNLARLLCQLGHVWFQWRQHCLVFFRVA